MIRPIVAAILAAGQSTRMGSKKSKVLHILAGKPLISYPIELAKGLDLTEIYVIVGGPYEHDVREAIKNKEVKFVRQEEPRGTGDALNSLQSILKENDVDILVLPGDAPLLTKDTVKSFLNFHQKNVSVATVMTAEIPEPTGYGRILRSSGDRILMIVEEIDAFPEEREIKEVNSGIYLFSSNPLFRWLKEVTPDNEKGEYYLTDVIGILQRRVGGVYAYKIEDWREILGVNTRKDLAQANGIMQERLVNYWMSKGVSFVSPQSVYLEKDIEIGKDTVVYPFVSITGNSQIGESVEIGPGSFIKDAVIQDGEVIPGASKIYGNFKKKREKNEDRD